MFKGLILLIQFFTRIPLPFQVEYDPRLYSRNIFLIPLVGLILGFPLYGIYYLLAIQGNNPFLAAVLIVTAEIILTGALHIDGLADSADGFFSYRNREEMLEIMKDSRIGTNGTIAIFIVLLLRTGLIFSLTPATSGMIILLMPLFSRLTIPWLAGISQYARKEGMGESLVNTTGAFQIIMATTLSALLAGGVLYFTGGNLLHIPTLIVTIMLFTVLLSLYSKSKIGGITGDVIGAGVELSEIFYLTAALLVEKIPPEFFSL